MASRAEELAALGELARQRLEQSHRGREEALARCRETIRACGLAIRAVHRLDWDGAQERRAEARSSLLAAQQAVSPFPTLAAAGFLHDAEKEYAEACLTVALVTGGPIDGPPE